MLRITNLTDKDITITKNIILKARSYMDVQKSIDSRLYQLVNMNFIKIQEISKSNLESVSNNHHISEGSLRRKQMMEKIRKGDIKPGVSLDVSSYKQLQTTINESKNKRGRKSK